MVTHSPAMVFDVLCFENNAPVSARHNSPTDVPQALPRWLAVCACILILGAGCRFCPLEGRSLIEEFTQYVVRPS